MINLVHIYNLKANILQTLGPLPIYLLIFLVIYFIMIRPQVKQQKEHKVMLENIKKGDRIVTKGGIIGKIVNIKGKKIGIPKEYSVDGMPKEIEELWSKGIEYI